MYFLNIRSLLSLEKKSMKRKHGPITICHSRVCTAFDLLSLLLIKSYSVKWYTMLRSLFDFFQVWFWTRTTDTQWRHKSKISEKLGWCGRQNMIRPFLKIWEWKWIFGRAVKAIFSLGVRSPWFWKFSLYLNSFTI